MRLALLLVALAIGAQSRSIVKRNAYGDEQVTPAAPAPVEAPAPTEAPVEEAPVAVEQPTPAPAAGGCAPPAPAAQESGYRSKRNAYGDEQVTPAAPAPVEAPAPTEAPVEEAPVAVEQPTPAPAAGGCAPPAPAAQESGYRSKRNAYGDEQVTPAAPAPVEAPAPTEAPVEEAPVAVEQPTPAPAAGGCAPPAPAAQESGYRAKRNAYGDEQVTPAAPAPVEAPAPTEAPVEEAPVAVEQPTPAPAAGGCAPPAPAAQESGYRAKRNAYGDEQVTPAAPAPVEAPAPTEAPVEEAPVAVEQPTPAPAAGGCAPPAAAAQESGYRAKRNAHGDEEVTPAAPAPVEASSTEAPVEEAPVAVEQPTLAPAAGGCAPPAPAAQESGYRAKRNAYGDEQVTPAAPAPVEAPAPTEAPVEEAPVAVEQPTPAPAAGGCAPPAPAAQESGYRSKRNAYGDEQVPPAAPAPVEAPAPTEAPVEEAPVAVEQPNPAPAAGGCAPPAPAAQESGYRAKRNAYGDEQVTPAAPAPVEAPAPTEAPVEEAPVAVEQPTPAPAAGGCAPPAPAAQESGYRAKRNAYGDEQVTPAAPAPVEAPAPTEAPVEEAPVAVEQPTPAPAAGGCAPPAPAQSSGY